MAALASPTASSVEVSTPSATKKRKHEGDLGRSSSKKRKQDTITEAIQKPENDAKVEAPEDLSSEKKRRKDRKKKRKTEEAAEQTPADVPDNDGAPVEPKGDEEIQPAQQNADSAEEQSSKKKRKKKRKDRGADGPEHTNDEPLAKTTGAATTTTSDVEMPDAQPTFPAGSLPPADDIGTEAPLIADLLASGDPSPFHSTRISLYLPLPAIALSSTHARSSLLAHHLSPLLLTYYPPADGIVLAFTDPVLSARAGLALDTPLRPPSQRAAALQVKVLDEEGREASNPKEVLSKTADEFGSCWAWLTVTLLVFRPERGEEMVGWTNVSSEGFVGLVCYNLFQAAVGKERIPKGWQWVSGGTATGTGGAAANGKKARKGKLGEDIFSSQSQQQTQEEAEEGSSRTTAVYGKRHDDDTGYFVDEKGEKVPDVLKFRVVDTDMVPGNERGSLALQIDATLLDEKAEQELLEKEKAKFESQQQSRKSRARTPGAESDGDVNMSGGLEPL